jgi:hypothetical protein
MTDTLTQFQTLNTGDTFFDPFSGEYFEKTGDTTAIFITGGNAFQTEMDCPFELNDEVILTVL